MKKNYETSFRIGSRIIERVLKRSSRRIEKLPMSKMEKDFISRFRSGEASFSKMPLRLISTLSNYMTLDESLFFCIHPDLHESLNLNIK